MRLFVTGAHGQLGKALAAAATARGDEFHGFDLPELDITDAAAVSATVARIRPDALVNCAAFTSVDAAEEHEELALAVNGDAVGHLAEAANAAGAALVQISTDYVFDGRTRRPYHEDAAPNPLGAYGRTKLASERNAARANEHLIVRTAWLFGAGANFVEAIRRQLAAGSRQLRVVDDQTGSPTYAADLAGAILALLDARARAVVHAVNGGETTWCGFAREIVRLLGGDAHVAPISTPEAARPAPRPAYSVLDTARLVSLLGAPLPPWQDALRRYLHAEKSGLRAPGGH